MAFVFILASDKWGASVVDARIASEQMIEIQRSLL